LATITSFFLVPLILSFPFVPLIVAFLPKHFAAASASGGAVSRQPTPSAISAASAARGRRGVMSIRAFAPP
jgi:hypothetical protein